MRKTLVFAFLVFLCLPGFAQQYSSTNIGKVSTVNNIDVTVSVDSAGTLILSTPTHSIYFNRKYVYFFSDTVESILEGMKELESKDITIQDARTIGKLTPDASRDRFADGVVFRLQFNATKDNKVLMLMYNTSDPEDMVFTTNQVAQLDGLVKKALKSGADFGDQFAFIQSVIDKITAAGFK
jgi:hypothetical protein